MTVKRITDLLLKSQSMLKIGRSDSQGIAPTPKPSFVQTTKNKNSKYEK